MRTLPPDLPSSGSLPTIELRYINDEIWWQNERLSPIYVDIASGKNGKIIRMTRAVGHKYIAEYLLGRGYDRKTPVQGYYVGSTTPVWAPGTVLEHFLPAPVKKPRKRASYYVSLHK
jgi:hypothetical protein